MNLEVFCYIYSLIAFNSMQIEDIGVGIFSVISKMNHSCEPNCRITFCGKDATIVTERQVGEEEELTISYINDQLPKEERQNLLAEGWGFNC